MRNQPGPAKTAVVALPAEIDIANADQVQRLLTAALKPGVRVLVADLTGTVFCDASGASALMRAHARATDAHSELRLAIPAGRVRQVLDVLGLAAHVQMYPSTGQALTAASPDGHDRPQTADRA